MKKPFTRAFIFVILYMTQDEKKMKHVLRLEFEAFTNMENLIEQHCNNKDCNCVFFQRGFIDSMNKIFKVVWSKTKECYVVVSEIAKNNGGKKKVLASVLAGLAMAGIGASGTPVLASYDDSGSKINIAPNAKTGNYVGTNSVVVGYENATDAEAGNLGRIIYGTANIAAGDSTLALGNSNEARGTAVVAVGHGSAAKAKQSVAIGNVARAEKDGTVAIGTYVNAETANVGTADKPKYTTKETGVYSTAVGAFSWSKGDYSTAYGYKAEATGGSAVALGRESAASASGSVAVGYTNKAKQNVAVALGTNNNVDGEQSTAVGSSNTIATNANQATAIGRSNTVNRAGAFVGGFSNVTNGERNVAVGSENTTAGEDSIGIGTKVIAGTGKTIAIGNTMVNSDYPTGRATIAQGKATINAATGQVDNIFALAIGSGAQADGSVKGKSGMIAIGQEVTADDDNTIAMGVKTKATNGNATAVGSYAQALGSSSAAFGTQAVANGLGATAFGPAASAGTGDADGAADGAVAIGRKASVAKAASGAAAIGWASEATKADATAIGHSATANIEGGVALGSESKTTVAAGVQGYNPASDRTDKYSTQAGAVGTSTLAAVSIGDGSAKTRQLTGLAAGTADTDAVNVAQLKNVNLKYAGDTGNSDVLLKDHTLNVKGSDFITTSADGTGIKIEAKVGKDITANADGKAVAPTTNGIATTENVTQAINKSGWKVTSSNNGGTTNGSSSEKVSPGDKVTFSAGKNIVLDQAGKQFTYSLNKDVDLTKDGSLTIGDTKINNAGMTITGGPSITKTGIDAGDKKITNVAPGTISSTSKDAVNGSQLYTVDQKFNNKINLGADTNETTKFQLDNAGGIKFNIKGDGSGTGGANQYISTTANGSNVNVDLTADAKAKLNKTYTVSSGSTNVTVTPTTTGDNTDFKITVASTGTTTSSSWNLNSGVVSTAEGTHAGDTTQNIADTKTVTMQAGKNLTVKQTNDGAGNTSVAYSLDKELTNLDKVVVNGKDGIDGKDGVSITGPKGESAPGAKDGQDGKVGIAGKDGKDAVSIAGKDGIGHIGLTGPAGKDGKNVTADITVKEGKAGVDGKDGVNGITRIVYQDKDGNEHEVATHDDGMKFAGDDGQANQDTNANVIKKHLNNVVDIVGGADKTKLTDENIGVNNDNGKLKVQLAKDVDLTKDGSLTIGDTVVNKDGLTITGGPSVTKTGIDAGDKKITNVAEGAVTATSKDAVNGSQLHAVKAAERHIKPGTYTVANDGSVTLNYVDGDGKDTSEKANITGIAKQDLSNINIDGKKVITGLGTKVVAGDNVTVSSTEDANGTKTYTVNAKLAKVAAGKNTTVEGTGKDTDPYKVNVEGDLADISSITNGAGSGKISFAGNQVVKVEGDNPISLDGKGGYVTGLQNKDWDIINPTPVSGRAATEDQLKKVSDGFNNTIKLAGNTGDTDTQKLNKTGGLSFGVVGANNGQYIKTTASGNNVVADLSDDAKAKLNHKVEVQGVGSNVHVTEDTSNAGKTIYKVAVDAATPTAASTESVVKKAAATGDTNIADVSVAGGKAVNDPGAQYEVSVSRNAVKDAAREAVTVNNGGTTTGSTYTADTNNPITVNPVKDDTNHNTTYEVKFDGNKAAKQIPLTYKATNNGTTTADQTVKLSDGLNFTGGNYTTASVAANGVVKFDVNLGDTPTVTNGKPGVPGAAGASGKDGITTISQVVETINNSGWQANAKANGGTLVGSATATVVKPGNTVTYAAGKNLTVKQEIGTDGNHTYTYALDKDLTNLDKVVVNGKDGIDGKDGVSITGPKGESAPGAKDGQDGKVGIAGKDGKDAVSIAGKDGVGHIGLTGPAGKDGKNATADITVKEGKAGVDGKDGVDGITRIVYQDKDGNEHQVATHDDGMKFAGDDGQANQDTNANVIKKHLNNVVDIVGGADKTKLTDKNIGVNNDNGKLKVQLAKDVDLTKDGSLTIGDTNITKDGLTITGGPSVKKDGIDAGDKKITNVAPGTISSTSKDAVNGSQLYAVKAAERHIKPDTYTVANDGSVTLNYVDGDGKDTSEKAKITGIAKQDLSNINDAGKKVITGLGTVVAAGDNVTVSSTEDANGTKTYTVNAITPAIYTDKDGNKVVKRPDGTYTTNLDGSAGNDVAANDVIVSFKDAAGNTTGGNSIVNNVGSAIKNQNPTMPAGQTATYLDKLKAAADDVKTQNAAVNVSDLHNTAKALKASELHIAPTVGGNDADKGGVASGNTNPGAATQAYKYNATTKQVELTFNDGNGKAVTGPKAVIDLSDLANSISSYGFKTNAAGNLADGTKATATAVANDATVTYAAGKNLTVKQEIGTDGNHTYTYALDKDLTNLDKVVVNGKDGIDGKDGVSITGPKGESAPGAKDGQDGKVGIAGKDGKDAVSIAGKDGVGHIGLTGPAGKDGKNATADITVKDGVPGVDGQPGETMTRIVYQDKDGNEHQVATHDDGMKFAGDDGQTDATKVIKKHLNNVVDIVGGADKTKLTDKNIGVNNDNGKLKVQLAKDVNLTDTGSIKFGDTADDNTVINKGGITITKPATGTDPAKTVSLTGDGLNNGGNTITNVKAGENDTDAVNVKQLKDKVTTVESSNNSIKVVDKNDPTSTTYDAAKGHQYDITINNQSVVEKAQTPVVYTDKDGNKLYKIVDPVTHNVTFNTKEDGSGTTVQPADVIASMNNGGDSTTTPMKLNNVGSSIVDHATPGVTTPTFLDKLDAAAKDNKTKNGAVNVSDLKNTADAIGNKGLNFGAQSGNDIHKNLGEKLEIVGGGTKADDKYDASNIKTMTKGGKVVIALDKDLKADSVTVGEKGAPGKDGVDGKIGVNGKDGSAVVLNGKDGSIGLNGKDGKNGISIKGQDGKVGVDGKDGETRFVYTEKLVNPDGSTKEVTHEIATMDDGMKYAGDDAQGKDKTKVIAKKLNQTVDIVGGADKAKLTKNNIGVNNVDGKLKVQLSKDLDLTEDGSVKIGDTTVNNDGLTINGGPSVKKDGINAGNKTITGVKAGKNDTDAVNVKQLKDKVTTVKSSDGSISVTDDNASSTDPTKGHAYDIKVNNQGVVNNAQLPVVYTKQDGTKVYKQPDGSFNTAKNGSGTKVQPADVIASMNSAGNSSTEPTKLNNVGSSIQKPGSTDTFLKQLDDANKATPNGAVNVSDLKKTSDAIGNKGLNFGAQSGNDIHKNLGEKLEIVGGGTKADDKYDASNIKTMTKDGKVVIGLDKDLNGLNSIGVPGKDGVAGKDGVSISGKDGTNGIDGKVSIGKDGKDAVSIAGKDGVGHIGLTGPKGADGSNGKSVDISTNDGKQTLVNPEPGADKSQRIVYTPQDKDGNPVKDKDGNPIKREVATMDDGLKFTGNNTGTENKHALNTLVKVQGEGVTAAESATFQSAAGNINVVADGNDTLTVKLNKDLKGINSIRNSENGPALNFNAGDLAITGGNLNMGGNKITNLGKGTNDTDAVNLKQLKDSRTIVKSTDGTVGVQESETTDGAKVYDLSTGASPRFDELTDEIGRVGAQGAALAALKPIQYDPLEPTQIMAGYGNYRGNSAIAMGVAHYKNESTMMHAGLAWAGGSRHMMANAGVTWKVGNRDSEAAVADRYRKGPISSAYAMQQEMAAMKAQNAGLRGEVSDLKAENEQMKAQIAAMMAKLGL